MAVPPLVAYKAATSAQKALTGDIYTRRWVTVEGKGKKKRIIEHEAHINPVGIGLGALAIGAAATAGVAALWLAQLKLTPGRVDVIKAAYVWPSDYGYASSIYTNADQPSEVPSRVITVPAKGYWSQPNSDLAPGTGDYKGVGGWTPGAMWVETSAAYQKTEYAVWTILRTEKGRKTFTIEQRRPFAVTDVVEAMKDATGLGEPIFGNWLEGHFLRK